MAEKKKRIKIILLTVTFSIVFAFFYVFDLQQYLTLQYLKSSKALFISYYDQNPILVLGSYFLGYVVMTAFSLPGAVWMTLGGGAFFGLLTGTVTVSFASTIGATLAMLISRFILRDWVQGRFGEQMQTINSGIQKDGGFYLFTLRLLPIVPFFVINLGMGLTPLRTFTFYWVSQLGMLPGTLVYINAGSELAKIEAIGDILSPTLIGSFVLLGIFPLLVKKLINFHIY
ncbi:MAG: VTT domain-containing protein [SAR324 cluster bacterium]|nr:VTT domain-containing protein [SAR324 cluster bacterium]